MQDCMMLGKIAIEPVFKIVKKEKEELFVCRSLLAVGRYSFKEKKYVSDFFQIVCFGKRAEYLAKACRTGDLVTVKGEFRNYNYRDVNETKHYTNYMIVQRIEPIMHKGEREVEQLVDTSDMEDLSVAFMQENGFLPVSEDMFEAML